MCPLRFLLVFFSAVLAGYFAWRTVRSSPETHLESDALEDKSSTNKDLNLKEMIQNGFWVFVDMASGRYLWRNLRAVNGDMEQKKSS
ncbi:methyltransferase-related protein [Senna tora]|uniref:Methyltransferase-related protein n=1 Tax=Senna tora TaxID=362788 RepID=A0A834TKN5_9FABA|nr:methyltransferase-related protein [Senna tora]